jgi:Na+/citrate or Na+/malate symporter
MGLIDLLNHLLNFVLPAIVVGAVLAMCARFLMKKSTSAPAVLAQVAINSVAGALALGAALWFFGRDGKMAGYGLMVLVVATCQWALAAGWRR